MPEDLSDILKKNIDSYRTEMKIEEVGVVVESGDGIVHIQGLPNALSGEMIEFPNNYYGMVFNLERENVLSVLFGPHTGVREGDFAKCTGHVMQVPVGKELLGRVVNALGNPIDGLGPVRTSRKRAVENPAPGVIDRTPVSQPLQTGYKLIDALIPIGRGQRELVIGDRSTGKSTLPIDMIINQKGNDVYCVYVAIGQNASSVAKVVETFREFGAMDYTIVVSAPASDSVAFQYLAPFSGCAMAEDFMYSGKDALIVYDDLSKHAQAYRMISLLLRRPPGREAYPGDVFYLHSRLLERSAKLNNELGGGSLTALPIVETQLGDVTAYIPTNIISITDGQIFLDVGLFNEGIKPSVNVGISVSRVGGKAQVPAMRKIAGRLRLDLAQYREKKAFSLFSQDVGEETQCQLERGALITEVLKQDKNKPMPIEDQIISIYAATRGYFDKIPLSEIAKIEKSLLTYIRSNAPEIIGGLREFSQETEEKLKNVIIKFKEII